MIHTAQLLTNFEYCTRRGFFSQFWQRHKLDSTSMLHEAVKMALTEAQRPDFGEYAGEMVMELAAHRGLDLPDTPAYIYDAVLNHAALADILVTAIRKPQEAAWSPPPTQMGPWNPSALLSPDNNKLRRILCVSNWSEERKRSEVRSWFCLGEVCRFEIPMELVVAIVGPMKEGKRRSHWTQGLLHPANKKLRFQRKEKRPNGVTTRPRVGGFGENWQQVYREDHAEISREKWIQAMLDDDVLRSDLFVVDIPVPNESVVRKIKALAQRKLEKIRATSYIPQKQLTGCDWPSPCPFRFCCWSDPEKVPSQATGFDVILENKPPTFAKVDPKPTVGAIQP